MKNVSFEDEMADLEQKLDRGNVLLEETTTSKRKLEDEIQQLKNAQRNRTVMFGAKAAEVCSGVIFDFVTLVVQTYCINPGECADSTRALRAGAGGPSG